MSKLTWEPDAEQALSRAPFFVRPLARRKVEERVLARGGDRVTLADVREGEARFKAVAGEKSDTQLERMMPQPNQPGAPMLAIEVCHCELSGCPNVLIKPQEWKQAIEEWARATGLSERLRQRVEGERILFHHKLRVAIAGCPNGCSRPQIADVGLVGFAEPRVDPEKCIACRACEAACPDRAITVDELARFDPAACQGCTRCRDVCPPEAIALSPPAARLLMGGKLGRHPHLAQAVGTAATPAEAVHAIAEALDRFLAEARPGERFAEHWLRTRGAAPKGGAQ
ncbi:MAG TPA: 4Fe-4S binding protein [Planctomycetota bacterium]|nr:4Fe-4S binding protein [Planctomycetota bacterium]HRR81874.1 4Fe-4S binding protein [Planctomycetota bacterium]HRT95041.1 4Fe-4S binding protein [Planctomycetota bacterium]